ncbi:6729_t:CDS:2 [Entrophospora sp. SA101]|nr:2485_t:CDS:2 [Entrophospora sp. SA101]CAJ0827891.1 6729_t:CDS:2 [Entrophospora sp. SA101]
MDYTLHLSNTSHTNHPQVRGHFGGFVSPISSSTSNTSNSNINNNVNNPSNMMGGKKRKVIRSLSRNSLCSNTTNNSCLIENYQDRMNLVDNNNDDKFKLISSLSLASSSPLMDCDEQQFSLNEELDEENMHLPWDHEPIVKNVNYMSEKTVLEKQ